MAPKAALAHLRQQEVDTLEPGRQVIVVGWNISEKVYVDAKRQLRKAVLVRPDEVRFNDSVQVTCQSLAALYGIYQMYGATIPH
jgi:hypothetical protein